MPHDRLKSENYENFGGVNTKASVYLTGPREALKLFNFDGSRPGDLTARPGSTQYFSATFSGSLITGLYEYTKLNGFSKIMVAHPGGMWLGQDNSVTGVSLGSLATAQSYIFQQITSPSTMNTQSVPGVSFTTAPWDMATMNDHQFMCDGRAFLKYNGSSFTYAGLPDVMYDQDNETGVENIGFSSFGGLYSGGQTPSGYYFFAFAYLNERGFLQGARINPRSYSAAGATNRACYIHVTFPLTGFGITAMYVYSYYSPSIVLSLESFLPSGAGNLFKPGGNYGLDRMAANEDFRLLAVVPLGGTMVGPLQNPYRSTGEIPNTYEPFGQTNYIVDYGGSNQIVVAERVVQPEILENFKSHLFWIPPNSSSAFFSDVGEPEGWESEWEFEFRTDDGDKATAMKAYGNRLMVGKEMSLHEVTGDDAENFNKREISTEYGILNNKACCVWEGRFWFLDRKGIAEYTGGLPKIVSAPVEDYFARMNLSAAKDTAEMAYMKNRDEVWTLIPIDGSSVNNFLIIYNTQSNQFYFWEGVQISTLAKLIGRMGSETSFFGDYRNRVNTFGSSLMGDNGQGFTSLVQFRYESPMGKSIEKMFRRLFVDAESLAGNVTLPIETRLRANFGTSAQVSASMVLTSIQKFQDFGIPAKSLSVEISHFSATDSLRLHGYTLEYRWLRNN